MLNLVIGASTKPFRYSFMAINRLRSQGLNVKALGLQEGEVADVHIDTGFPEYKDVDTVLMYINPDHQPAYYDYILKLKPRRIIFNPGSENKEFIDLAQKNGIEVVQACSLVLLSTGQF